MRSASRGMVGVAGVLVALALAREARAQMPAVPVYGPLGIFYSPRPLVTPRPMYIGVQTSVLVPDRGTALLGGYSRVSAGRTEYGVPGLGKVPYLGRGFRNVGYGRSIATGRVGVSVRIIDLREEEYRQTGYRSR
jgi:Flp pilus assembly secretin CpaC